MSSMKSVRIWPTMDNSPLHSITFRCNSVENVNFSCIQDAHGLCTICLTHNKAFSCSVDSWHSTMYCWSQALLSNMKSNQSIAHYFFQQQKSRWQETGIQLVASRMKILQNHMDIVSLQWLQTPTEKWRLTFSIQT